MIEFVNYYMAWENGCLAPVYIEPKSFISLEDIERMKHATDVPEV